MHKDKQIFVTFSAGVTDYRPAERIEDSLERADQALYKDERWGAFNYAIPVTPGYQYDVKLQIAGLSAGPRGFARRCWVMRANSRIS